MIAIDIILPLAAWIILLTNDIVTALLRDEGGTTVEEVPLMKIKTGGPTATTETTSTSKIGGQIAEIKSETVTTDEIATPNLPPLVEIDDAIIVREAGLLSQVTPHLCLRHLLHWIDLPDDVITMGCLPSREVGAEHSHPYSEMCDGSRSFDQEQLRNMMEAQT